MDEGLYGLQIPRNRSLTNKNMNTEQEIKNLKQQFKAILEKLDRLIDLGQDVENRLIALEKRSNENGDATTSDAD